jgi:hypothetical protein
MPLTRRLMIAISVLTTLGLILGLVEILGGPHLIDAFFSPWFAVPALVATFFAAPLINRYLPYKRDNNLALLTAVVVCMLIVMLSSVL